MSSSLVVVVSGADSSPSRFGGEADVTVEVIQQRNDEGKFDPRDEYRGLQTQQANCEDPGHTPRNYVDSDRTGRLDCSRQVQREEVQSSLGLQEPSHGQDHGEKLSTTQESDEEGREDCCGDERTGAPDSSNQRFD